MAKEKIYKFESKSSEVKEANQFVVFTSFEEEAIFVAKERAEIPYDKRMIFAEELRKRVFSNFLLPDGTWSPIEKIFKIMPPYCNEISR